MTQRIALQAGLWACPSQLQGAVPEVFIVTTDIEALKSKLSDSTSRHDLSSCSTSTGET